jgi:hypothetical protein
MFDQLRNQVNKLLGSPKVTSAEIRRQIEEIVGQQKPNAESHLEELRLRRQSSVLIEKQWSEIGAEITKEQDLVDALDATLVVLRKKLADVLAEERRSELVALVEAARRASDEGVEQIKEYHEMAAKMADLLAALLANVARVKASWEPSREIGDEKVQSPLRRAAKTNEYTEFPAMVALPMLEGNRQFFWPPTGPAQIAEINSKLRAAS